MLAAAHRGKRQAEHLPTHPVAVATVARIAVETLARMGHDEIEKRRRILFDGVQYLDLLL